MLSLLRDQPQTEDRVVFPYHICSMQEEQVSNNIVQGIHILCPDFGFKHSRTVNLVLFLLKLKKDHKHGDMYKIRTPNCRDLILF